MRPQENADSCLLLRNGEVPVGGLSRVLSIQTLPLSVSMSGTNINQEISSRVESFVQDLAELIRAAALESVREALGGGAAPAPAARPAKPTRK